MRFLFCFNVMEYYTYGLLLESGEITRIEFLICQNAGLCGIRSVRIRFGLSDTYQKEKKLTMRNWSSTGIGRRSPAFFWSGTGLRRWLMDARMPMPSVVSSTPMPSYANLNFLEVVLPAPYFTYPYFVPKTVLSLALMKLF